LFRTKLVVCLPESSTCSELHVLRVLTPPLWSHNRSLLAAVAAAAAEAARCFYFSFLRSLQLTFRCSCRFKCVNYMTFEPHCVISTSQSERDVLLSTTAYLVPGTRYILRSHAGHFLFWCFC
ncbi:unnamed protein product, partial [Laminaria digitata]